MWRLLRRGVDARSEQAGYETNTADLTMPITDIRLGMDGGSDLACQGLRALIPVVDFASSSRVHYRKRRGVIIMCRTYITNSPEPITVIKPRLIPYLRLGI